MHKALFFLLMALLYITACVSEDSSMEEVDEYGKLTAEGEKLTGEVEIEEPAETVESQTKDKTTPDYIFLEPSIGEHEDLDNIIHVLDQLFLAVEKGDKEEIRSMIDHPEREWMHGGFFADLAKLRDEENLEYDYLQVRIGLRSDWDNRTHGVLNDPDLLNVYLVVFYEPSDQEKADRIVDSNRSGTHYKLNYLNYHYGILQLDPKHDFIIRNYHGGTDYPYEEQLHMFYDYMDRPPMYITREEVTEIVMKRLEELSKAIEESDEETVKRISNFHRLGTEYMRRINLVRVHDFQPFYPAWWNDRWEIKVDVEQLTVIENENILGGLATSEEAYTYYFDVFEDFKVTGRLHLRR